MPGTIATSSLPGSSMAASVSSTIDTGFQNFSDGEMDDVKKHSTMNSSEFDPNNMSVIVKNQKKFYIGPYGEQFDENQAKLFKAIKVQ